MEGVKKSHRLKGKQAGAAQRNRTLWMCFAPGCVQKIAFGTGCGITCTNETHQAWASDLPTDELRDISKRIHILYQRYTTRKKFLRRLEINQYIEAHKFYQDQVFAMLDRVCLETRLYEAEEGECSCLSLSEAEEPGVENEDAMYKAFYAYQCRVILEALDQVPQRTEILQAHFQGIDLETTCKAPDVEKPELTSSQLEHQAIMKHELHEICKTYQLDYFRLFSRIL
jgi:hypothetical protein